MIAFPRRLWRFALPVAATLTVLPLFLSKYLPFCDLPEHLAVIATLQHWWDPSWHSKEYFSLQGPMSTPYILYHFVAAGLGMVLGTAERANLLLLILAGVGFPYALRALLLSLGRDPRLALFACCLFYSRALAEGLITYVVSIPVVLLALALVVEQCRAPARRRSVWLILLVLAIFYLHLSSFLVFFLGALVIILVFKMGNSPDDRSRPSKWIAAFRPHLGWILAAIPPIVLLVVISSIGNPERSHGIHSGVIRFATLSYRGDVLWSWMHDFWKTPLDDIFAAIAWGTLVLLAVFRTPPGRGNRALRIVGPALLLLVTALYFFMPSQVSFAFILDLRLAPYIGLFAVLLPRPRPGRLTNALFALLTFAVLAHSINTCIEMRRYDRGEARYFDHVLRNLPKGKKLLTLVFHKPSEYVRVSPFIHFGAYYRARFGGISSFSFSEIPYWLLQYKPEAAPPKKSIVFWDWNPCLFRNSVDGDYYDFILLRGDVRPFRKNTPGPRWQVIGAARDWVLYAKYRTEPPVLPTVITPDRGPCAP